ncbi:MAG: hypothetical protein JWM56_535 [Candidatus Peribacteria bacterium]|nr:hypothetical protein [Candidatus Peribacteria bacterium]
MHSSRHLSGLFFALCLLLLSSSVFAQKTGSGGVTGSGSLQGSGSVTPAVAQKTPEQIAQEKDRARRLAGFTDFRLKGSQNETAFRAALTKYRTDRSALRAQCREDIRRSNKDALLATKLRCVRGELTLDREYYRAADKYAQAIPGQLLLFKKSLMPPLESALEAVNSFVNAIDQGVFENEEQLITAKKNLQKNYRDAANLTLTLVRADKLLNWLYHTMDLTNTAAAEQNALAGEDLQSWASAKQCLSSAEQKVLQVFLPEETQKKDVYRQLLADLTACTDQISAIPVYAKNAAAVPIKPY